MTDVDTAMPEATHPMVPDDDDEPTEATSMPPAAAEDNTLNGEDLFGSDDDNDDAAARKLDDEALDSGDDLDRDDRAAHTPEPAEEVELRRNTAEVATHPLPPVTADKELYLLKVPKFLGIEPAAFDKNSFTPPTTDHHSKEKSTDFSAHKTAMKTLRWRRAPSNSTQLQSNARVLRWSDGSLTLQLATDPTIQYQVPAKPLAAPLANATKPSPSAPPKSKAAKGSADDLESHTYLTHPSISAGLLLTTAKLTSSLTVTPSQDAANEAIARLTRNMQKARSDNAPNGEMGGMGITQQVIDPELAQKQAEQADKEAEKLRRRREQQELKEKERANKVLGRRGVGGGLNAASLEDDEELGMGIRRRPAAPRKKRANRNGEIYSDDDMDGGRGRTREDEYDEEDDFLVGSDEEEEIGEEVDEDDIDEQIERKEGSRGKKRATPEDDDEEQDAEGEPDEEAATPGGAAAEAPADEGSPLARSKRRRVIDDEDDEE